MEQNTYYIHTMYTWSNRINPMLMSMIGVYTTPTPMCHSRDTVHGYQQLPTIDDALRTRPLFTSCSAPHKSISWRHISAEPSPPFTRARIGLASFDPLRICLVRICNDPHLIERGGIGTYGILGHKQSSFSSNAAVGGVSPPSS